MATHTSTAATKGFKNKRAKKNQRVIRPIVKITV